MTIQLGKTEASLLNPPNEGVVIDSDMEWTIGRNRDGMIVLRKRLDSSQRHPDFTDGMTMETFCCWINSKL